MLYRTYRVSVLTLAAAALAALLMPDAAVQAATLLGLYEFEGNFNDTSGNAAHGFGNTGVAFNGAGFQGQAGQFNGASSFDVPVNIDVTARPKATIGAWVNADVINTTARHEIVSSDNNGFDRTLTIDSRDTGGGEAFVARYSTFNGSGALLGGTTASIADGYVLLRPLTISLPPRRACTSAAANSPKVDRLTPAKLFSGSAPTPAGPVNFSTARSTTSLFSTAR